jgi:SAM-dependent methyltransferase
VTRAENQVSRIWDKNAEAWAEAVAEGGDRINEAVGIPALLALAGDLKGLSVLDAGCGEGRSSRHLANRGALVTGIDFSPRMIELARDEEARVPLGIDYQVGDFARLSGMEDSSFDVAVSVMALMDAPDLGGALREFSRLLRPGGQLVFLIRHPCFLTRGFDKVNDKSGNAIALAISGYFATKPYMERWPFSFRKGGEATSRREIARFPRTLSDYLNGVLEAGLTLANVVEPRPTEADCQSQPRLTFWRNHAALFLCVGAIKPI